ncbi:MAG: glycosyltransferase family 1 protein [Comamonadaceae bacterium]|nr:MAG: glycosyltransferase family 1 protein [Comamonadaceae bacterium]
MNSIIVFSHLRWDFVYQRPQQLMSRLAAKHPVLFVEEPALDAERPWAEVYSPCNGVQVLRMHLPGTSPGFADENMPAMRALLIKHLVTSGMDDYVLWFYTPMALPLARGLTPLGSVYDCMDELAAFDFAPKELLSRERDLFKTVDLVLTGGRSLYEAKRDRHADVHCFPSSVDHAHFGQPDVADHADHADQAGLARPRLGYFGVIDERLDLGLIAALADSHPAWQIVMVGPVAKLDPASLPQRPNIHWMGQRLYNELPAFLAGWDVCLMPFALNASTRFISPTKTLEYLAAGRPVVSTAIRDVEQQYAAVVPIAHSSAEFIAACEAILQRTPDERSSFKAAAALTVSATSWEHTATAMLALLQRFEALRDKSVARSHSSPKAPALSASAAA